MDDAYTYEFEERVGATLVFRRLGVENGGERRAVRGSAINEVIAEDDGDKLLYTYDSVLRVRQIDLCVLIEHWNAACLAELGIEEDRK